MLIVYSDDLTHQYVYVKRHNPNAKYSNIIRNVLNICIPKFIADEHGTSSHFFYDKGTIKRQNNLMRNVL